MVGPGTSPLSLPDAIANSLSYVKAFGGTEQRDIPDNYLQRQFIYMMDGSYLLTDIVPASNYKVEMDFQTTNVTTASDYYLGVRDVSSGVEGLAIVKRPSSVGGALAFDGFQAGNRYVSSYVPTSNTRYKYTYDNGTITLTKDNTVVASHTFTPDSTVTSKLAINGFNDNGSVLVSPTGLYLYSFKVWNTQGELVLNLVPAIEKGSTPVVGFYDTVSKSFMTATAGTFAAGGEAVPTPATPMDIVSNNGVLKARMSSGLPFGYQRVEWISSNKGIDLGIKTTKNTELEARFYRTTSGAQYAYRSDSSSSGTTNTTAYVSGGGNWRFGQRAVLVNITEGVWHKTLQNKDGVNVDGSTSGTYDTVNNFTSSNNLFAFSDSNAVVLQIDYIKERTYGTTTDNHYWVACKRYDGVYGLYDMIGEAFYTTAGATITGGNVTDSVETYADGTVETIAIKDDQNTTVSTATCEDLLSVGTYTDEQEVISGVVTRKVGVKVLDGTENWILSGGVGVWANFQSITGVTFGTTSAICSHSAYAGADVSVANMNQNEFSLFANGNIAFKNANTTSTSDWTTFLAQQYAAGTPVIVLYPLATPTTESVTAQPMQTAAGDNTVEIAQASMSGLELEVEYLKDE